DREFSAARAPERLERGARAAALAEVAHQRADVEAGGTGERQAAAIVPRLDQLETRDADRHRRELDGFVPPREVVRAAAADLLRGIGGRHLHLLAVEGAQRGRERLARRRAARPARFLARDV